MKNFIKINRALAAEKKLFVVLCASLVCAVNAFAQASDSKNVDCDGSVTIQASPLDGFHFVEWNDGVTDNPRTVTNIKEAKIFTATFAANETDFGDDVEIDNPDPQVGDQITLTANSTDECLEFEKWSDGVTDNPRTITYNGTVPFTAVYKTKVFEVTINADASQGTVTFVEP